MTLISTLNAEKATEGKTAASNGKIRSFWIRTRAYFLVAAFMLLIVLAVFVTARFHRAQNAGAEADAPGALTEEELERLELSTLLAKSSTTLVTAFFGLGRAGTPVFDANLLAYHAKLRLVTLLRLPLVIFTDANSVEFVTEIRESIGMDNLTKIWETSVHELPLYAKFNLLRDALGRNSREHEHGAHTHAVVSNASSVSNSSSASESYEDEEDDDDENENDIRNTVAYHILVNSKPYFAVNASVDNPFNTTHFVWLDSNYGDGNETFFPKSFEWLPDFPDKGVSVVKLTPTSDPISLYTKWQLFAKTFDIMDSGFFAGRSKALKKFAKLYVDELLDTALVEHRIDAVELTVIDVMKKSADLFNVVQGEWFSVFHLF